MQVFSHQVTLLQAEVRTLQEANEALSKRRRAKRTRLQDGGAISGSYAREIMAEKGVVEEEGRVEEENEGSPKRRRTGLRLCGSCRKAGHNVRTCPTAGEMDSSSDSE
jgi:DNA repair exonuclease SbcCD ATPase subunit